MLGCRNYDLYSKWNPNPDLRAEAGTTGKLKSPRETCITENEYYQH